MKAKMLCLILAACFGITAVGCGPSAKEKDAIGHVLKARYMAMGSSGTTNFQGLGKFRHPVYGFDNRGYLQRLKQIETDTCPMDFRTIWLAYVQTWERFATPNLVEQEQKRLREHATASHIEFNPSILSGGIGNDARNLKDAADKLENQDTSEAFRKVETLCLSRYRLDVLKFE
jgi:hypothetical protein